MIGLSRRPLQNSRFALIPLIHVVALLAPFFAAVAMLATLSSCAAPSDQAVANTSPAESGQVVVLSQPGFIESWNVQLRLTGSDSIKALYVTPDPVDDTVHAITEKNFDHAIKRTTGDFLYFNQVGDPNATLVGGPILVPGHLVFATDHTLELFRRNGRFEKSIDLKAWVSSPPVAGRNLIFLGLAKGGGEIAAIDLKREYDPIVGEVLTRGAVDGAPAVQGTEVFVGSESGGVLALEEDHTSAWTTIPRSTFMTNDKIFGAIKTDPDSVYAASSDGVLYCLALTSGMTKWRYFAGAALERGPDVTATTVYQFVPRAGLVAIDTKLRQPLEGEDNKFLSENPIHPARWIAPDATRFLAEDKKYTYALSTSNTILALDKQTGRRVFESHRTDLSIFATNNNPKDATIYAATKNGHVFAIKAAPAGASGELVLNMQPIAPTLPRSAAD